MLWSSEQLPLPPRLSTWFVHAPLYLIAMLLVGQSLTLNFTSYNTCKVIAEYDKQKPPLIVQLRIEIHDILDVNVEDHTVTIYLMLKLKWKDEGLLCKK